MLVREISWRPAEEAVASWADDPYLAWLDSGGPPGPRNRTSYLAVAPFQVLEAGPEGTRLNGQPVPLDPFTALARELARFPQADSVGPVPFVGGAVGFLGYELARHLEAVPSPATGRLDMPDMVFGFYNLVLAFDTERHRAWLLSSGLPYAEGPTRQRHAAERADWALARLEETRRRTNAAVPPLPWRRETTRPAYRDKLARILTYISAGDIYQANLTTRFLSETPAGLAPFDIYTKLRRHNPAPFAAYLGCGPGRAVASASPERFISLDRAGRIESRPLKGTRPRGISKSADAALAADLASSVKDRAENLMIVDLLRNDIGRVAEIGSVRVPTLYEVESFPAVHHLVSVIEAQLRPGLGPVDLLRASFPGGSITGAPKIRAMEIIAELEDIPRGPYCGAVAWIGFDGAMDSNIAIRTLTVTPEIIAVQAGGGIVADSDPDAEFEEMMVKVRPLLRALGEEPA
ncbi:MAG TPA: aminodeoxychorismate synthase component I [Acidisoma sp.]|jgi:para-aminobenzoate synthetase component 1|nr:aminodeoxychorismate synthase component I [Acidisoma sp.]